jgi:hypothetical protein
MSSIWRDDRLSEFALKAVIGNSAIRKDALRYLQSIGWSDRREKVITRYITQSLDDDGFLRAINVLLDWSGWPAAKYSLRMSKLANSIYEPGSPTRIYGALLLHSKFSGDKRLDVFIRSTIRTWRTDEWLARQVCALYPRLRDETKQLLSNTVNTFGLSSARSVLDNWKLIEADVSTYKNYLRPYLTATKKGGVYPVPKYLLAMAVVGGGHAKSLRQNLLTGLLQEIRDPIIRIGLRKSFSAA